MIEFSLSLSFLSLPLTVRLDLDPLITNEFINDWIQSPSITVAILDDNDAIHARMSSVIDSNCSIGFDVDFDDHRFIDRNTHCKISVPESTESIESVNTMSTSIGLIQTEPLLQTQIPHSENQFNSVSSMDSNHNETNSSEILATSSSLLSSSSTNITVSSNNSKAKTSTQSTPISSDQNLLNIASSSTPTKSSCLPTSSSRPMSSLPIQSPLISSPNRNLALVSNDNVEIPSQLFLSNDLFELSLDETERLFEAILEDHDHSDQAIKIEENRSNSTDDLLCGHRQHPLQQATAIDSFRSDDTINRFDSNDFNDEGKI